MASRAPSKRSSISACTPCSSPDRGAKIVTRPVKSALMTPDRRPHRIAFACDRVVGAMRGIEQRQLPIGMLGLGDHMAQRNSCQADRAGMFGFIHQQRRVRRQLDENAGQSLLQRVAIARVDLGLAQRDRRLSISRDVAGERRGRSADSGQRYASTRPRSLIAERHTAITGKTAKTGSSSSP